MTCIVADDVDVPVLAHTAQVGPTDIRSTFNLDKCDILQISVELHALRLDVPRVSIEYLSTRKVPMVIRRLYELSNNEE